MQAPYMGRKWAGHGPKVGRTGAGAGLLAGTALQPLQLSPFTTAINEAGSASQIFHVNIQICIQYGHTFDKELVSLKVCVCVCVGRGVCTMTLPMTYWISCSKIYCTYRILYMRMKLLKNTVVVI